MVEYRPSGPRCLAPHTLALRQRLQACLSAIHGFHEARLDDECAFYTSRALGPGSGRVCTNPVATLLEWQDALVSSEHSQKRVLTGRGPGGSAGPFPGSAGTLRAQQRRTRL